MLTPDKQNRTKVLQKVARRLFWNYPRTVVWLKAGGGSYGKHGSFYYNSCSDKNVQSTLKYFISEYYMLVNTNAGSQIIYVSIAISVSVSFSSTIFLAICKKERKKSPPTFETAAIHWPTSSCPCAIPSPLFPAFTVAEITSHKLNPSTFHLLLAFPP